MNAIYSSMAEGIHYDAWAFDAEQSQVLFSGIYKAQSYWFDTRGLYAVEYKYI